MKINKTYTATKIEVKIIHDNLVDWCQIYWQMVSDNGIAFEDGNINIQGDDYLAWDGSNKWLYKYIAKELNIEICTD